MRRCTLRACCRWLCRTCAFSLGCPQLRRRRYARSRSRTLLSMRCVVSSTRVSTCARARARARPCPTSVRAPHPSVPHIRVCLACLACHRPSERSMIAGCVLSCAVTAPTTLAPSNKHPSPSLSSPPRSSPRPRPRPPHRPSPQRPMRPPPASANVRAPPRGRRTATKRSRASAPASAAAPPSAPPRPSRHQALP